ncbi:hypothetical protein [Stutzerimonas zhaodongensis]|jgi:hypothetical protein|uniref:hypothetical protein n=1 Tax=Stutzerimonas zhaodongensis TaxID=1176257 RepID=UPI001F4DE1CF|nr:hypothetical protein [Stutzerimonas zhaodongensis]UNG17537.1 hypothetical protein MKP10_17200 [Stutzerimonas zhaodongensis]
MSSGNAAQTAWNAAHVIFFAGFLVIVLGYGQFDFDKGQLKNKPTMEEIAEIKKQKKQREKEKYEGYLSYQKSVECKEAKELADRLIAATYGWEEDERRRGDSVRLAYTLQRRAEMQDFRANICDQIFSSDRMRFKAGRWESRYNRK